MYEIYVNSKIMRYIEAIFILLLCEHKTASVITNVRSKRITGDQEKIDSTYTKMLDKWPWVVRLQFSQHPRIRCGGTLISKNLVLTAAHCVSGFRPEEITVISGDIHTYIQEKDEQVIDVQEIIIHHSYNQVIVNLNHCGQFHERVSICVNDVALLVLSTKVACNRIILLPWSQSTVSVLRRRFPNLIDMNEFEHCYVAGWGYTSIVGPYSELLRDANVFLLNPKFCNGTCRYGGSLVRGMLCAAGDGGQDACVGDSGGPLMCVKDNTWRLVGVVSWGLGCGDPLKPGVYADVGHYQEWILSELIRRPRLESQFWNSILECKSPYVRVRECNDPWDYEILRLAGIRCRI